MRDKNSDEFNRGRHRIREWADPVEDRRLNRDKFVIVTDLGLQFMLIFMIFLFKKKEIRHKISITSPSRVFL